MLPVLNREYTINIDAMTSSGAGIGKVGGFTLFISGAVTGDTVLARISKLNKSYGFADLLRITSPSPFRRTPPCPHFNECGGCQLMAMSYDAQCEYKKGLIADSLLRIGGINCEPEFFPATDQLRYRNKMVFPISSEGEWGFYRSGTHQVVPLNDCLLGDSLNADIMNCIKDFFCAEKLPPYNEFTHTGILRRVFTRTSSITGNVMVVISVNADSIPHRERLVYMLRHTSERISSVILNINKRKTNLVLGDRNILLYGDAVLADELSGLRYDISSHSFFQINHAQTEHLYQKVLEYAMLDKTKTVFDLYCGIGTISLCAAVKSKHVIGVEIVPDAIDDARKNAENNGISNADFYCSAAEDIVPELIRRGECPDTVILDPPRKGSDEKTLDAILAATPERIVYVSCNPATLARDVKFLTQGGYTLACVSGFDMFPQTKHVETVCLLSRKDK